jgi:predicted transcriptional regulator of viral defense system
MQAMKRNFGKYEAQLMAYVQLRNIRTLKTGDLVAPLRLTAKQERELLSRLTRGGVIARVRRGMYLVPPRLPLGGQWTPSEALAISTLMGDQGGRYQICGPNAFNRYGFDEQVPARVYAYNNRLSGERTVGSVAFTLIKVQNPRLGDTEEFTTPEGLTAVYSSRVRTLMDAVYDWSRFDGLPRSYGWIRKELSTKRVKAADLVRVTLQYGNQSTIRRIGALLEAEGVAPMLCLKLERALRPSSSLIPYVPVYPKRGKLNRRWGLVFNDQA